MFPGWRSPPRAPPLDLPPLTRHRQPASRAPFTFGPQCTGISSRPTNQRLPLAPRGLQEVSQNAPGGQLLLPAASLTRHTDARSLFSRESFASTTISLCLSDSQSVASGPPSSDWAVSPVAPPLPLNNHHNHHNNNSNNSNNNHHHQPRLAVPPIHSSNNALLPAASCGGCGGGGCGGRGGCGRGGGGVGTQPQPQQPQPQEQPSPATAAPSTAVGAAKQQAIEKNTRPPPPTAKHRAAGWRPAPPAASPPHPPEL
ncbi:uncharacterized protein LOC144738299 [Lampetra planeri]